MIYLSTFLSSLLCGLSVSPRVGSHLFRNRFSSSYNNLSKIHPELLITTSGNKGSLLILTPEDEFEGGVARLTLAIPRFEAAVMLKPINGLFCFVNERQHLSRIYNLGTRQANPWVRTSLPLIEMDINPLPNYAFGFDPSTGKHKVLCILVLILRPVNTKYYAVYANGSIYMRNYGFSVFLPPDKELIVAFDVGIEKFRVIEIPKFIIDYSGTPKVSCTRQRAAYLLQVDGYIALIDRVDEQVVKLWIYDDSYNEKKRTTKWTDETIMLPFLWKKGYALDVNAVEGTNELIIKSPVPSDETLPRDFISLYIYDRGRKSSRKIDITVIYPSK